MFRLSVISSNATYSLARNVNPIGENSEVVTITLTTTGVQNGQSIPYTITGTGITSSDFVGSPSLTGNFVVQNNTAYFTLTTYADNTLEGPETFTVTLNDSGAFITVNITDTSAVQPGDTWTSRGNVSGAGAGLDAGVWTGSRFLVGDMTNGQLFESTTGVTWTAAGNVGQANGAYIRNLELGAESTIIATLTNGTVSISDDGGTTWTNRAGPFGASQVLSITWGGTKWLAGGADAALATSPDGITWTARTGLLAAWTEGYIGRHVTGMAWDGTNFIVGSNQMYNANIATSPDGITWTRRNVPGGSSNGGYCSGIAAGGGYVVIAATSGGVYVSSDHGASYVWVANLLGSAAALQDIIWTGTRFIVMGEYDARASVVGSSPASAWAGTLGSAHQVGPTGFVCSLMANSTTVVVTGNNKVATSP